jgi:hypothetical protein
VATHVAALQSAAGGEVLSVAAELEDGDFRAHIEANAEEVTYAAADVHSAAPRQFDLAGGVAFVEYRQERWRQKWRLALAAVGVPGKNPALVAAPDRAIRGIGIVAEHNGGTVLAFLDEQIHRIEPESPQVVESEELQSRDGQGFIAKNCDTRGAHDPSNFVRHVGHPPSEPVVVVTENADSSEAAVRRMRHHPAQLLELSRAAIGDPIAGENHEVGSELLSSAERLDDVVVVHFGTDVQIAELRKSAALEFAWEPRDG